MNLRKKFAAQIVVLKMFLVVLVFGMVSGTVFQFTKIKEYKKEIASLNNQIEITNQKIETLKKVDDVTNIESLEDIARTKLKMVKPNEIIYIVTE